MKEQHILRQVAISLTASGGLGYGDKLAFSCKADLSAFSAFTKRTVMIVGTTTAKQMLNLGVEPTAERPWVVISRGSHVEDAKDPYKHLLYATDLGPAVDLAEQLVENSGMLVGYTIIGGGQTYEKLITSLGAEGSLGDINSAYILKLAEPACEPDVKLSVTADKFDALIRANMISDTTLKSVKAGYQGRDGLGVEQRLEGQAVTIIDSNTFDPTGINLTGNLLSIELEDDSKFTCRLSDIAGWSIESRREVATLWFAQRDLNKELRLASKRQGLNYLDMLLRRNMQ